MVAILFVAMFIKLIIAICHLSLVSCYSAAARRRSSSPPIIACKNNAQVQRAIDTYIQTDDVVLELGSQLSDTSACICRAIGGVNGNAVLVDVKRKEATSGRSIGRDTARFIDSGGEPSSNGDESYIDRVSYHELEDFEQWRVLIQQQEQLYDALILDVGATIGNDLYLSAISIVNEFIAYQTVKQPRVVIVKSKTLSSLAKRILHSQRLLDGTVALPTTKHEDEYDRSPSPILVPCVGVNDYRKTIPFVVRRGDSVLEVGCHFGTTTSLLHNAAVFDSDNKGFCIGVDIGEKIIQHAKHKYPPEIIFEVVDAWNTLDLLKVKIKHCSTDTSLGYDIVYADIGGLSGAHGLLESLTLLDSISRALEPRCIVIKSLCMKRLASQLIPVSRIKVKAKEVPS